MEKYTLIVNAGTTNLRIFLLNAAKQIVDSFASESGVRLTALDGNNNRFLKAVHDGIAQLLTDNGLTAEAVADCIAYGMITSNLGLKEVPHLAAPAGLRDFRDGMVTVMMTEAAPFPIRLIPGLKNLAEPVTAENAAQMDMMRGEETEAIGLCHLLEIRQDVMLVLPGSHNKFIAVSADGKIGGCMTSISGELLDALTHHTILSGSVQNGFVDASGYNREMMLLGASSGTAGLGRAAFVTRILQTLGHASVNDARSFLLGVVLQEDLTALRHFSLWKPGMPLLIAGKAPLSVALADLLQENGFEARLIDQDVQQRMGIAGACRIAGI